MPGSLVSKSPMNRSRTSPSSIAVLVFFVSNEKAPNHIHLEIRPSCSFKFPIWQQPSAPLDKIGSFSPNPDGPAFMILKATTFCSYSND